MSSRCCECCTRRSSGRDTIEPACSRIFGADDMPTRNVFLSEHQHELVVTGASKTRSSFSPISGVFRTLCDAAGAAVRLKTMSIGSSSSSARCTAEQVLTCCACASCTRTDDCRHTKCGRPNFAFLGRKPAPILAFRPVGLASMRDGTSLPQRLGQHHFSLRFLARSIPTVTIAMTSPSE